MPIKIIPMKLKPRKDLPNYYNCIKLIKTVKITNNNIKLN